MHLSSFIISCVFLFIFSSPVCMCVHISRSFEPDNQHKRLDNDMEALQKENGWKESSLVWGGSCFLDEGGKGNRISLWVKSWGLLWEGIDRRWNTEERGSTYQILPTHTYTHTHQSLLIKTVYAHTLIGIQVHKLFLLLNTTLTLTHTAALELDTDIHQC